MTIKEVEQRTGLTRSNIRFYEKEKLIEPLRNEKNGYRDYSEKDVETIKKIAYLRTLEISIEDIRCIITNKTSLTDVIEKQMAIIKEQIEDLNKAKVMCERILQDGNVSFDELQVESYVTDLQTYWNDNQSVFKLDSVSFVFIWGSFSTWMIITALCFIIGIVSYTKLPSEIPVQWGNGIATSFIDKRFIFVYPFACIVIHVFLRPVIYVKLVINHPYREPIAEYLANYLCFIALSVEGFSILFVQGLVKSVVVVLLVDTVVLIGILIIGIMKMALVFIKKDKS